MKQHIGFWLRRHWKRNAAVLGLMLGMAAVIYVTVFGFQAGWFPALENEHLQQTNGNVSGTKTDYIKYVEFNVTAPALEQALNLDIHAHEQGCTKSWIELLAYLGAKYGGDFSKYKKQDLDNLSAKLDSGSSMEELTNGMKYYPYYLEAYTAVLGGLVGEYRVQTDVSGEHEVWEERYGLIGFSPIAKNFPFEHYDDFGAQRTYGYKRRHLGHDLMAATGTPVVAIESGTVEAMGWNQYGGWRIGIRSHDKKRYYYYAHLRQNRPFAEGLQEGMEVTAGDVIGYVGHTGYSTKENVNNIEVSHLHLGLELIFDESQKESNNEIWVNLYPLTIFLNRHKSEVLRVQETKEYYRKYKMEIVS